MNVTINQNCTNGSAQRNKSTTRAVDKNNLNITKYCNLHLFLNTNSNEQGL